MTSNRWGWHDLPLGPFPGTGPEDHPGHPADGTWLESPLNSLMTMDLLKNGPHTHNRSIGSWNVWATTIPYHTSRTDGPRLGIGHAWAIRFFVFFCATICAPESYMRLQPRSTFPCILNACCCNDGDVHRAQDWISWGFTHPHVRRYSKICQYWFLVFHA